MTTDSGDLFYYRYDQNDEDAKLVNSLKFVAPNVQDIVCSSPLDLSNRLPLRADLAVLSGHGKRTPDGWRLVPGRGGAESSIEELMGYQKIVARVFVVAACWSDPSIWAPYLSQETIAFVATGELTYGATRKMLRAFLPFVTRRDFEGATTQEIEIAWCRARKEAVIKASTLTADMFQSTLAI